MSDVTAKKGGGRKRTPAPQDDFLEVCPRCGHDDILLGGPYWTDCSPTELAVWEWCTNCHAGRDVWLSYQVHSASRFGKLKR